MAKIVYPAGEPTDNSGTELLPRKVDLVGYRGDDLEFGVTMSSRDGKPVNMTGWQGASVAVKGDETHTATITVSPDGYSFTFFLPASETSQMLGNYNYDVQFVYEGRTRTYMGGVIKIEKDYA
jgi:hypothetical protein